MSRKVEAAIQRALVDWIAKTYPHLVVQATLNENSHKCVDMGICVGITDLIIFSKGNILFLELKTKDRNSFLSPSQIDWYRDVYLVKLKSPNTHYAVAKGLAEAKEEVIKFVVDKPNPTP